MPSDIFLVQLESAVFLDGSIYNLGLLSIGTVLKNNGYAVKALMTQNFRDMTYAERMDMFRAESPAIVGFNVNSDNVHGVAYMAEDVKRAVPAARVVVGGPLASIEKERLLDRGPFDFVMVGEGEYSILALCRILIGDREPLSPDLFIKTYASSLDEVPGLVFRRGGRFVSVPRIPFIKNLDDLPSADYTLTDVPMAFKYSSGRGCPFACAFCSQGVHAKGYRVLSPERVVSDVMTNMRRLGARAVGIVDDTFIAHRERAEKICSLLKREREKSDFIFCCEGRVDILDRNPDLVDVLYDAGLRSLQMGIENGNQKILDLYNKRITLSQIEKVVGGIAAHGGISIVSNFILGGPVETPETIRNTIQFARHLIRLAPGLFECSLAFLCPYPGTEIAANPAKFGLRIIDDEWVKTLTVKNPSCETDEAGREYLTRMGMEFDRAVLEEMMKVVPDLSFEQIDFHAMLYRYGLVTNYYSVIISNLGSVSEWYSLRNVFGAMRLCEIPSERLKSVCPRRIGRYTVASSGGYRLEGWVRPVFVSSEEEKAVWDLSSGKLTVGAVAEAVAKRFRREPDDMLTGTILPFYERMEKSFHMAFGKF